MENGKGRLRPVHIEDVLPEDRIHPQYVYVDDLIPYANNPRNNDGTVQELANSFRDFGVKVPLVITRDGIIITGHTRLKAAIATGRKALPCLIAKDLDDAKAKMFRLADNKIQELSGWDFEKLAPELQELKLDGWEPEDFGFTPLDLTLEDPFASSEIPAPPEGTDPSASAPAYDGDEDPPEEGDCFDLGGVTLVCGTPTLDDILDAEPGTVLHVSDPEDCADLIRQWEEATGRSAR